MSRKSEHPSVLFFAGISGICCILFVAIEVFAFLSFRNCEQRIVNHYKSLGSLSQSNFQVTPSSIDSLIVEFGFDSTQRLTLQNVAMQVVETSVNASLDAFEQNEIIKAANNQIFDEVKFLLEEQTAKIEHEYISLEIWCALLTIVFLIFSFFSLLKSDDLVKQGEAGVEALKNMRKDAASIIEKMTVDGKDSLSKMESEGKIIIDSVSKTRNLEFEKYNSSVKDFISKTRLEAEQTRKEMSDIIIELNNLKEHLSKRQLELKADYTSFVDSTEISKNDIVSKIKDINNAITLLERRINNISTAVETKEHA